VSTICDILLSMTWLLITYLFKSAKLQYIIIVGKFIFRTNFSRIGFKVIYYFFSNYTFKIKNLFSLNEALFCGI